MFCLHLQNRKKKVLDSRNLFWFLTADLVVIKIVSGFSKIKAKLYWNFIYKMTKMTMISNDWLKLNTLNILRIISFYRGCVAILSWFFTKHKGILNLFEIENTKSKQIQPGCCNHVLIFVSQSQSNWLFWLLKFEFQFPQGAQD